MGRKGLMGKCAVRDVDVDSGLQVARGSTGLVTEANDVTECLTWAEMVSALSH